MSFAAYSQSDILLPRSVVEGIVRDLSRYDQTVEEYKALSVVAQSQTKVLAKQDSMLGAIKGKLREYEDAYDNCLDQNNILAKSNDKLQKRLRRQRVWYTVLTCAVAVLLTVTK